TSGCRPMPASPASPPVRATTAARLRSPANIAARRTAATVVPVARATASVMTPSSAPWRSSPVNRRRRKSTSAAVARASSAPSASRRRAVEPGPVLDATSSTTRSTSWSVSDGVVAGCTSMATTVRHPIPTRPWRGAPVSIGTAMASSSGVSRERNPPSASIFADRADVDVTAVDVATSSANSTGTIVAPSGNEPCTSGRVFLGDHRAVRAARGREPVEANSRHPVAPLAPTPEHLLLDVQRTAGNRAATRLVQRDGPATEPATEANPAAGAGATYARVELKDFGLDFDLGTPPKRPLGGTYAFTRGVTLKPPVHPKESDLYSRDGHGFPVHSQQGTVKQPFLYQSLEPVLFPDNRPSRNDVQQESIGDCWDLSALMAIATQDRGKLMEVMTPAGDGARVKLWHYKPSAEEGKPGTWERVEIGVTGELPFKQQPGGPRQFVGAKPQTYPMRMDWWA